jgi:hypothetical protein
VKQIYPSGELEKVKDDVVAERLLTCAQVENFFEPLHVLRPEAKSGHHEAQTVYEGF